MLDAAAYTPRLKTAYRETIRAALKEEQEHLIRELASFGAGSQALLQEQFEHPQGIPVGPAPGLSHPDTRRRAHPTGLLR